VVILDMKHHARRSLNGFPYAIHALSKLHLVCDESRSCTAHLDAVTNDIKEDSYIVSSILTQESNNNTEQEDYKHYVCYSNMNPGCSFCLSNLASDCHIFFIDDINRFFTIVDHLAWSVEPILFPSANDFVATNICHLSWAVSNVIIKHAIVDCSLS
jgi:hypothetical protein